MSPMSRAAHKRLITDTFRKCFVAERERTIESGAFKPAARRAGIAPRVLADRQAPGLIDGQIRAASFPRSSSSQISFTAATVLIGKQGGAWHSRNLHMRRERVAKEEAALRYQSLVTIIWG